MSLDSEWDRVLGNPDNVIVSDSLKAILDASQLEREIVPDREVSFTCVLDLGNQTLVGTLLTYETSDSGYSFSLECSREDAILLIGRTRFQKVVIANSHNEASLEVEMEESDPDPNIRVDVSPYSTSASALVNIVISK